MISLEESKILGIQGVTSLGWNAAGELIWIKYEYAGYTRWQAVTDTNYTGSTGRLDVTRWKGFGIIEES